MVALPDLPAQSQQQLSVLALSSRFDGHALLLSSIRKLNHFQYSLCRVVLMVLMWR